MKYKYPGLRDDKTAAGTIRWRVRVAGKPNSKILIPFGPEEDGFLEHYHAARRGEVIEVKKAKPSKPGSLDDLRAKYGEHLGDLLNRGLLSKYTRDGRVRALKQAADVLDEDGDRIGHLHSDLPKEAFDHILKSFGKNLGTAETCLKALRAAFRWGKTNGFPTSGTRDVEFQRRKAVGATTWKPKDIVKFLNHHRPGSMARLWFALADTTAGRVGDMNWLGPDNFETHQGVDYVAYQPRKRGSKHVSAPIQDLLRAELAHHDLSARDAFLINEYGEPFASPAAMGNKVRDWIIAASLCVEVAVTKMTKKGEKKTEEKKATRSQHGIRKAVAEAMASNDATIIEIMALLGHSEMKTTQIYIGKVNRRKLAASGRGKMSNVDHDPESVVHIDENLLKNQPRMEAVAARRGIEPLFPG